MMQSSNDDILIVGAGIGGLTLALSLRAAGLGKRICVFEAVQELKPVGEGIILARTRSRFCPGSASSPHCSRVQSNRTITLSSPATASSCITSHGQAQDTRRISIDRAELHEVLANACVERMGSASLQLGCRCIGVVRDGTSARATMERVDSGKPETHAGSVLIACDGVRSFVRSVLYPNEGPPRFHGINLWRGVATHKPFPTGNSIARVGAMHTTIIIYPIHDNVDGNGNQLINWVSRWKVPPRYQPIGTGKAGSKPSLRSMRTGTSIRSMLRA